MEKKCINLFVFIFIIIYLVLGLFKLPCYAEVTFTDASVEAGVDYTPVLTWGCNFVDINGDGYMDIFIDNHYMGNPYLYINNGSGGFSEEASLYGLLRADIVAPGQTDDDFHGSAWGDFDNDGDQDVYIALGFGGGYRPEPKHNHLMRNDGSAFVDIAVEAGVSDETGRGRTPMWVDYDNDGYLDLFVTNLRNQNSTSPPCQLFKNNGDGTFTDVTHRAGVEGQGWGFGLL